jgi:hypothetical protein
MFQTISESYRLLHWIGLREIGITLSLISTPIAANTAGLHVRPPEKSILRAVNHSTCFFPRPA